MLAEARSRYPALPRCQAGAAPGGPVVGRDARGRVVVVAPVQVVEGVETRVAVRVGAGDGATAGEGLYGRSTVIDAS